MSRELQERILLNKVDQVKKHYYPMIHRLAEMPGRAKSWRERDELVNRIAAIEAKFQDLAICVRDMEGYKKDIALMEKEIREMITWQSENYQKIDQLTKELLNMPELTEADPKPWLEIEPVNV